MTDPLTNGQDQGQHPRRSRKLMATGALAAALAVGGGMSIAAAASPVQPAGGAVSIDATGTSTTTAGTTGGGSSSKVSPLTAGTRPTPPAHRPHLGGTVTAVDSGTITIKDRDGFRRQIKTSSKTVYSDGLKSPVAVGTQIGAEGTVDANGTSLDATTIRKAPQPGDGGLGRGRAGRGGFRPGHMGGPGQGGPGRHDGTAPTPRSGAPTPPSGTPAAPSGAPAAPSGAPSTSTSAAPTS